MPRSTDDFDADAFTKKVDDLETFRKEFEGEKLYEKIGNAIQKSKVVESEIKKIAWTTIREKIVLIILGGVGIILADLIIRAIPNILKALSE